MVSREYLFHTFLFRVRIGFLDHLGTVFNDAGELCFGQYILPEINGHHAIRVPGGSSETATFSDRTEKPPVCSSARAGYPAKNEKAGFHQSHTPYCNRRYSFPRNRYAPQVSLQ